MTLEPQMLPFIERTESFYPSDAVDRSVTEHRALYDAMCRAFNPPRPAGMGVEDRRIPGPGGHAVPVRLYRPRGGPGDRVVLYFHGGGFILGGLDSHDIVTARLAADLTALVVAVDYRLAPEHLFPAAFDDCLASLAHVRAEPAAFGLRAPRVVLMGDSAGANLAAAVAIAARQQDLPAPAGQVLFYGGFGAGPDLPSYVSEAEAPLLNAKDVGAYRRFYMPENHEPDYRSAPILGPLDGLAPTLLIPVEHDPLRDESTAFRDALVAAGSPAELKLGRGLVHGCLRALETSPETRRIFAAAVEAAAAMFER